MEFGQVEDLTGIDFTLPPDHPDTICLLSLKASSPSDFEVRVGCGKWNRRDLKNFYPQDTEDELAYYGTQFNSIELNATFYRLFPTETFEGWYQAVPEGFCYFPKLEQTITHYRRLKDVKEIVDQNIANMSHLREKLKMPFLQLHNNFGPKDFNRIETFVKNWTYDLPLAIEFRLQDWYSDTAVAIKLYQFLQSHNITHILVDTAGRRDLLHMRLTTPIAFVRWIGANDAKSDRLRLDEWVDRIAVWKEAGLQKLYFFVHQNVERESPALAAHFIERLNDVIGTTLSIPKTLDSKNQFLTG